MRYRISRTPVVALVNLLLLVAATGCSGGSGSPPGAPNPAAPSTEELLRIAPRIDHVAFRTSNPIPKKHPIIIEVTDPNKAQSIYAATAGLPLSPYIPPGTPQLCYAIINSNLYELQFLAADGSVVATAHINPNGCQGAVGTIGLSEGRARDFEATSNDYWHTIAGDLGVPFKQVMTLGS